MRGVLGVLPLLFLVAIGLVISRQPWFGQAGEDFLSKMTVDVAIPVNMFYNVITGYSGRGELVGLAQKLPLPVIQIFIGFFFAALLSRLLRIPQENRGVFMNAAVMNNTIVAGIPIVAALFGEDALVTAMVYYSANTTIFWTLGVWLLRRDNPEGSGNQSRSEILKALSSRALLGFLAGILWVLLELPQPPDVVMSTCKMLCNLVTPLAMFFIASMIGHTDFSRRGNIRELGLILGYRLLVTPVLSAVVCSFMPTDTVTKTIFFFMANMPIMAQLPIMAKESKSNAELASMATASSTLLCIAMVPFLAFAVEALRLFL